MAYEYIRDLGDAAITIVISAALISTALLACATVAELTTARWRRVRRRGPTGYCVGRREPGRDLVYFVDCTHIEVVRDPAGAALPRRAWGTGVSTERLAACMLWHSTDGRRFAERQLRALAALLETLAARRVRASTSAACGFRRARS